MKRNLIFGTILIAVVVAVAVVFNNKTDKPYTIKNGMIHFAEPERVAGQTSMLGFAAEPIDTVRVGIIGIGQRGRGPLKRMSYIDGVKIVAICDRHQENIDKGQARLAKYGMPTADGYVGEEAWKEMCQRDDIDLIYITTPWHLHTPMAVYAMEHGKHVAIEVPAATSVAECWQLVDTSERTRRHCMMLENCIYDHFELTTLNMVQQGIFGEIVHVEGGYLHSLDKFWPLFDDNWRLKFNQAHDGDVYATHGLGPICFALNIHRGDRMTHLVAMDTNSWIGSELSKKSLGTEEFANGDHTATLIRTHKGKTIGLQHNVYTPRPYSRQYEITGTKGYANKYPTPGIALEHDAMADSGVVPNHEDLSSHKFLPKEAYDALIEKYRHPIQKELLERALKAGGHGGMDFIMDYRLIYCLRNGLPLDQDVYDAAEWSCIGDLSAASIQNNSMPVAFPDFTRGEWDKLEGQSFAK